MKPPRALTLSLLLTTVLPFSWVWALENHDIHGQVLDARSGDPLPHVNIVAKGTNSGTTSDEEGYFSLVPPDNSEITLVFTYIGYEQTSISYTPPQIEPLEIHLSPELIEMSTLVVTGTRTERYLKDVPVTTQVIKAQKLQETGGTDVSQALSHVTGIAVVENLFGAGIEIAGFDANHVLVMVDGVKMIGRTNGQLDISQLPVEQIERIEIVKGATSALYGSEAMGGVVNIITQKPGEKLDVKLGGVLGSYGRLGANMSLSAGLLGWQSKLNLNSRFYGGNVLNTGSLWENGSEYDKLNLKLVSQKSLTENLDFNFQLSRFDETQTQDLNVFDDVTTNLRHTGRVELKQSLGHLLLDLGMDYSDYDHLYERIVKSSGYVKTADRTREKLVRAELKGELERGKHALIFGSGYDGEAIVSDRVTGGEQMSALSHVFVQDEWSPWHKAVTTLGLRFDNHSIYGNYLSPKISLMYKPEMISRVRVSFGQGFRAPTFKELYIDYTVQGIGYRILGNTGLQPERSTNFSLDLERWHTQLYHGRINLFYNHIDNLIDYAYLKTEDNLQLWRTENIRRAKTSGLEIDLTYFVHSNIEMSLGYTYLDTWDVDNESPINLKAKHKANMGLRWRLWDRASLNLKGQYTGGRYYGEESVTGEIESESWLDSYTTWNLHLQGDLFWNFVFQTGVKNLTDVYDPVWGPMPGREWYFGINYDLGDTQN